MRILAEDDAGNFLGGVTLSLFAGWVKLELFYVEERNAGVGSAILAEVEAYARSKGMKGIYLSTFSFQSPQFYRKHGFTCCGEIKNVYGPHSRIFFEKRL
ncbi:MAG: GNAT family N-acetyltransferase [Proteobacteria bacterium]|nr:GNAT family N-acetyltransferase [Pseudomonadota bacterium]